MEHRWRMHLTSTLEHKELVWLRISPRRWDIKCRCHPSSLSTTATMLPKMVMKHILKRYGSQSKATKQIISLDDLLENIYYQTVMVQRMFQKKLSWDKAVGFSTWVSLTMQVQAVPTHELLGVLLTWKFPLWASMFQKLYSQRNLGFSSTPPPDSGIILFTFWVHVQSIPSAYPFLPQLSWKCSVQRDAHTDGKQWHTKTKA